VGIASSRELARTLEGELGGSPKAVRTWVLTLSDNTLDGTAVTESEILTELSLDNWGAAHPALSYLKLRKLSVSERYGDSPYHVQVTAEYGAIRSNELEIPTSRDAEWSLKSEPSQVAAFYYFDGTTRRPLVNSAKDYYEGLTTDEQLVRATIKKNYTAFPKTQMKATNSLNSAEYFSCPKHTWKVAGVNTVQTIEIYNGVSYEYWATTCELLYRESTWNLRIPDVGWNFLDGTEKRRAMVFDFKNSEWVASPNPVALDGEGKQSTSFATINEFRVNPEINFQNTFGTPPQDS
jgi:hypothetical protein